jgi:membrane protease YdiL (CAAX protease family)
MDKRLVAIFLVCIVEIIFRAAYSFILINPLYYTMLARSIEIAIILHLTFNECGIIARSVGKELMIGLGVAVTFSLAVILTDLASRIVLTGGVLKVLLGKQHIENPVVFFFVGCMFAPFVEELFFRGLLYSWLRQRIPIVLAVAFSALFFASMHGFVSPVQLIGGILFATIYEWRKNIWASYVLHVLANFGIWIFPWVYPFWGV